MTRALFIAAMLALAGCGTSWRSSDCDYCYVVVSSDVSALEVL